MATPEFLNKITIGNIRRFGRDVEIEVGKGATVFLAPNGTGKTAIFEAIELALTGEVYRLEKPPIPLIRDNEKELNIRLEFDSGKFCEVAFKKDGHPVLNGDHRQLFGIAENVDTPFLLRLTHILPQQASNWFVQVNRDEAGNILDKLAIGREAIHTNNLMTGAKKAANLLADMARRELSDAQELLDAWKALLEKRGLADQNLISSLKPLAALLDRISELASNNRNLPKPVGQDLPSVKAIFNATLAETKQAQEFSNVEWNALQVLTNLLEGWPLLSENAKEESNNLGAIRRSKTELDADLALQTNAIRSLEESIGKLNTELRHDLELRATLELLSTNRSKQTTLNANLVGLRDNASQIESRIKEYATRLRNAITLANKYAEFNVRYQALAKQDAEIATLGGQLKRWEELDGILNEDQQATRQQLESNVAAAAELLNIATVDMENILLQFHQAQENFDALNEASGSMKEAVGIIVTNFPSDLGECPVCLSWFSPDELRSRMERALSMVNPQLPVAAARVDQLKDQLFPATQKVNEAHAQEKLATDQVAVFIGRISILQTELEQIMTRFRDSKDRLAAVDNLNHMASVNASAMTQLETERSQTAAPPATEAIALYRLDLEKEQKELAEIIQQISDTVSREKDLRNSILTLEKSITTPVELENLNEKLTILQLNIGKTQAELETSRNALSQRQAAMEGINDSLSVAERRMADIKAGMDETRQKWIALALPGEPNQGELQGKKDKVAESIGQLESREKQLRSIGLELSRWDAAQNYLQTDAEIKHIRQNVSEQDYEKLLTLDLGTYSEKLQRVQLKINTLNAFAKNLAVQIGTINERIQAINPLWNQLLRRVVLDPRFGKTTLTSRTYYNKQRADVQVPLHDGHTKVTDVASEAQITDLQLTFLLAMARKYPWTSWPVLLLDDPTQHHDLVHASSVFDLLRDYIAQFGFQVILATHDVIQARFFMLKLENDGIPARLWTLNTTADGVTAIPDPT